MKNNVVPFKAPETFERFQIDWTKEAKTEAERALREAFLTYETSCGSSGLIRSCSSSRLSSAGSGGGRSGRRRGLRRRMLAMQLRKHVDDALACVQLFLEHGGSVWDR